VSWLQKNGKIKLDSIWTDQRQRRTYGNEERYFLRKLRSSYGILTDERNSYVLLQRTTEIRLRRNGHVMLETTHYADGRRQAVWQWQPKVVQIQGGPKKWATVTNHH